MKPLSKTVIERVLMITKQVHKKYEGKLYKNVPKYRDPESGLSLRDFLEKAKESPQAGPEELERIETYLNAGVIDELEEVVDEEVAKEYDKALDAALLEAIDKGILPKYALNYIKKKTRKYVRKLKANSTETTGEKKA